MIDMVSFMWGVIAGQGSFIVAFILAKITRPLMESRITTLGKANDPNIILCPKCQSKKIAYTQTPGQLWCNSCGHEWENGRTKTK